MGIYCKSISPGTETVHSSTKNSYQFVTFLFVDCHFHCENKKKIGNIAKILNLQTAILTFINDKLQNLCISHSE